ncbi:MAG: hypothetical protein HOB07_10385 [Chloroflexi bacterium]|jgi:hypothetical protein|nr:hypothetical protein [Chloroflexota bacterium]
MAVNNPTVDNSFVKEYEALAHLAYQRQGSHLRGTVRTKNNVRGESAFFQVIGKGTASTKSRHGKVPVMNLAHSAVECALTDHYAGEFVDRLDELKLNIDEMGIAASSGAYALGRKTDELLVTAAEATSNTSISGVTLTSGLKAVDVHATVEEFGDADVPDDGQRFWITGWSQWGHLMQITAFTSMDFQSGRPHEGTTSAKSWNTFTFMPFSGLTDDGTDKTNLIYHRSGIGHCIGAEISTDITWQGLYAAHFVDNMMSMGAVIIDGNSVYKQAYRNVLS